MLYFILLDVPPFEITPNDTGIFGRNNPSFVSQILSISKSKPHAYNNDINNWAISIVKFAPQTLRHTTPLRFNPEGKNKFIILFSNYKEKNHTS